MRSSPLGAASVVDIFAFMRNDFMLTKVVHSKVSAPRPL